MTSVITALDNGVGGVELCSLKHDKVSAHWEGLLWIVVPASQLTSRHFPRKWEFISLD